MDAVTDTIEREDAEPTQQEMSDALMRVMRGLNAQLFRAFGNKVLLGPFHGMLIPERTPWGDGNASCKLFGSYEFELIPAIEHAMWRRPRVIVNVGCADGYYACGLVLAAKSEVTLYAMDVSLESLDVCCEYVQRNSLTERVIAREGCRAPEEMILPDAPVGHRLYFMDVETAEVDLLDKQRCPMLVNADIIVECHDFMRPDISILLADRFADSHRVEIIRPQLPRFEQYPFLAASPTVMTILAVTEKRPLPTLWLALWANAKG